MEPITEKLLNEILWKDISILKMPNGKAVLILVCDTKVNSERLLYLLRNNSFDLNVLINNQGKFTLRVFFLKSEYGINYDTDRTQIEYPPLGWLKNSIVTHISTGVWGAGNNIEFNRDVFPISSISWN